jgi:hypothetical protein
MVAKTPMVAPVGTPVICTACESVEPPTDSLNVKLDGLAVALDPTTFNVTLIVCAGTLGAVLETVMVPV